MVTLLHFHVAAVITANLRVGSTDRPATVVRLAHTLGREWLMRGEARTSSYRTSRSESVPGVLNISTASTEVSKVIAAGTEGQSLHVPGSDLEGGIDSALVNHDVHGGDDGIAILRDGRKDAAIVRTGGRARIIDCVHCSASGVSSRSVATGTLRAAFD
jgi:hypothetical protein